MGALGGWCGAAALVKASASLGGRYGAAAFIVWPATGVEVTRATSAVSAMMASVAFIVVNALEVMVGDVGDFEVEWRYR